MEEECKSTGEGCGATKGVWEEDVVEGGEVIVSISDRILGRFLQENLKHPITSEVIGSKDDYIDEASSI